jgi:hypothetical protein
MKYVFEYSPSGTVVADDLALSYVENQIKECKFTDGIMYFYFGTEVMIQAVRILALRGVISYEDILFKYKDTEITIDKYCSLSIWPKGFCGVFDDFLIELLTFRFDKKTKE